jgi:hypothetical protein
MQPDEMVIDPADLERVRDTSLFYPCSGRDFHMPLEAFGPWCTDFHFVDTAYFGPDDPEASQPVISLENDWFLVESLVHRNIPLDGEGKTAPELPVLTETYRSRKSPRIIRIHRHKCHDEDGMRKEEMNEIGVFFFRGTSTEGSSTRWLTVREWGNPETGERMRRKRARRKWRIFEILERLVDGGLIVTDGSMCFGKNNPYRELKKLIGDTTISNIDAVVAMQPFEDPDGRRFRCVGCLGRQRSENGPTMVWQVERGSKAKNSHQDVAMMALPARDDC